MAPPAGTLRVGRYFSALLALVAVLYLAVFWPGTRHTPKLGLDLEGGTQVIFTAKTTDGKTPPSSAMAQAQSIMTERVNSSGVTEATVVRQGSNQLVVSVPKSTDTDVAKLGVTAQLNFRGLVAPATYTACTPLTSSTGSSTSPSATSSGSTTPSTSPSASSPAGASQAPTGAASAQGAHDAPLTAPLAADSATTSAASTSVATTSAASTSAASTPATSTPASPSATTTAPPPPCSATPFAALEKAGTKIPTSEDAWNATAAADQSAITAALSNFDCASGQDEADIPTSYYVACDSSGIVYLLGTVIVKGTEVSSASAVAPSASGTGGSLSWTVSLSLKSSGSSAWAKYTSAHNVGGNTSLSPDATTCSTTTVPCADFVAFTLDGAVISAPYNISAINGGDTQIEGSFTETSANDLASQLKYGALPLKFTPDQQLTVSPTLGSTQLKYGLIAGGIGLLLVVLYSMLYYRLLGLVTIASLLVSGILVYASLVVLGTNIDFTVSLAGIAGFIVSIGITADSFVVFFERLKDEIHDGRSARVGVPRAWIRARRTIISADVVSFLAAAILYFFAAGDVRGFAFTLGLSTILDVAVVFLFTHPLVSFLSRFKSFGTKKFTGLDSVRASGVMLAGAGGETFAIEDVESVQETVQEAADAEATSAEERAAARRARLRAQREEGEV
ncbi:MAG TPA: protein translocase subunit SecD [Jatrophihabitans sp.]